ANYGANTVSRVDLSSYQVTGSLDTGNGPVAVSKINGKLYILSQLSQNLEVYAANDESLVTVIPVGLEACAMVKTSSQLVVVNSGSDKLIAVNLSDDSLGGTKTYEGTPVAIVMAESSLYLASRDSGYLYEVSPVPLTLVDSVSLGSGIENIAYEPSAGIVMVASTSQRKIYLVNAK
ncbi:MAG: hypothetical protein PHQ23_14850, partial [Candidatus Wallbacteria bacterium]|nr:hypothetical protein [Candidatus Wallbacteria bacterium]